MPIPALLAATALTAVAPVFDAPVVLGPLGQGPRFAFATDGAGGAAAVLPQQRALAFAQRAPRAPFGPTEPFRAARGGEEPVAAGDGGTLAVAWRRDSPKRFGRMLVATRERGAATFGAPVELAGPADRGVRRPAVAVSIGGDVLVAFNSGTNRGPQNLKGGVTIQYRPAGETEFTRRVIHAPADAGAPVVALGGDGRGIVAYPRVHGIDLVALAGGRPVERATITRPGRLRDVRTSMAADGRAVVAWLEDSSRVVAATGSLPRTARLLRHPSKRFIGDLTTAASASGALAVAWAEETYDRPDSTRGLRGQRSVPYVAHARPRRDVRRAVPLAPAGDAVFRGTPGLLLRGQRTVTAAWVTIDRRARTLEATSGEPGSFPAPVTAAPATPEPSGLGRRAPGPPALGALDGERFTALFSRPAGAATATELVAVDGRD